MSRVFCCPKPTETKKNEPHNTHLKNMLLLGRKSDDVGFDVVDVDVVAVVVFGSTHHLKPIEKLIYHSTYHGCIYIYMNIIMQWYIYIYIYILPYYIAPVHTVVVVVMV